jgi:hypothetical protein
VVSLAALTASVALAVLTALFPGILYFVYIVHPFHCAAMKTTAETYRDERSAWTRCEHTPGVVVF